MSVVPSDLVYHGSTCMPAFDGAATLDGAISSTTAATLTINLPSSPFPASGEFAIGIDSEILWVTQGAPGNAAGTLISVIRGVAGTSAATHLTLAAVTMPAGGPVNFQVKVAFSDIVSGHSTDLVSSSSSDTKIKIQSVGRDSAGVLQNETLTTNGQSVVTGTQAYSRLLVGKLASVTTITDNPLTSAATSLNVASSSALPASGNYYLQLGLEVVQVTAGQGTTTLSVTRAQMGTTATAHQSGDAIYLLPLGDVAILDHTKVITNSTARTGSANTTGATPALFALKTGDAASVSVGQIIRTQGGTGANQIRTIIAITGYGTDIVAVSRDWGSVPDNTTTYDVWNGIQLDLAPNQVTECRRFLWNALADVPAGSTRIFYEKMFAVNNNASTALTSATVQVSADSPSLPAGSALDLATATAANDVLSVANRQTAFTTGFGSYITQPATVAYGANGGVLANGAAPNAAGSQAIALRLTLPAGAAGYNGKATIPTTGSTT